MKSDDDFEVESIYANKYSLENLDVLEILLVGEGFKILTINGLKVEDKFSGLELSGIHIKGGSKQDFMFSTKENEKFIVPEKCVRVYSWDEIENLMKQINT